MAVILAVIPVGTLAGDNVILVRSAALTSILALISRFSILAINFPDPICERLLVENRPEVETEFEILPKIF
jgi:hypothetical protein